MPEVISVRSFKFNFQKIIIYSSILCIVFAIKLSFELYYIIVPLLSKQNDKILDANFIYTFFYTGLACGYLLFGFVTDFFSNKKAIILALFLFLTSSFLILFSDSIRLIAIYRLLEGIGVGAIIILYPIALKNLVGKENCSKLYVLTTLILGGIMIFAPTIYGYLIETLSWKILIIFEIILLLYGAAIIYIFLPNKNNSIKKIKHKTLIGLRKVLFNKQYLKLCYISIVTEASLSFLMAATSYYSINVLKTGPSVIGVCQSIIQFFVFGVYFCILLLMKYKQLDKIIANALIIRIFGLCIYLFILCFFDTIAPWMLYVGVLVFALGRNFSVPAIVTSRLIVSPLTSGIAASTMAIGESLGG